LGRSPAGAIYVNPHALPRARWVAHGLPAPGGPQGVAAALVAPGFDPRGQVLLDPAPAASAGGAGGVILPEGTPQRLVLHTRSDADGYAVLTDAWFPGWEAQLDGAPAPVLRANLAFRAVAVPAGEHELVLRYRPRPLRAGLAVAAIAALGLALFSRGRS